MYRYMNVHVIEAAETFLKHHFMLNSKLHSICIRPISSIQRARSRNTVRRFPSSLRMAGARLDLSKDDSLAWQQWVIFQK